MLARVLKMNLDPYLTAHTNINSRWTVVSSRTMEQERFSDETESILEALGLAAVLCSVFKENTKAVTGQDC